MTVAAIPDRPVLADRLLATRDGLVSVAVGLGALEVGKASSTEVSLAAGAGMVAADLVGEVRERIRVGFDPLGEGFCAFRTAAERRMQGATYTPSSIVRSMTDWAANSGPAPEVVVDPGAGSGRFSVAAAMRFSAAQVVAVELDPLAALLARANFAALGLADRASVVVEDYRRMSLPGRGRTLFIGNPPYVRHHQIASQWKRWLTAKARSVGLSASQLAGLHVHFFLATALLGRPGDRGAFITSSEWLDVNYGSVVRELVLDRLGGRAIHVIAPEAEPFEGTQTTGAVTCFELGARPRALTLRRIKSVSELGALEDGQLVHRDRLAEAPRWTPLLRSARTHPDGYVELGELCRVHRGAVTGANRVFVVDPGHAMLPERVLFRSVTRARELFAARSELATGERLRTVIDLPADLDEFEGEELRAVERFLRAARRHGVHRGYIARNRRAWWAVGLRDPAPVLATYMARRPPAFVRNTAAARHINIAHGLYPRQPLPELALARLVEALRTSISVSQGRTYAGGLTKFEPREMERLFVPDVTVITP